VTNGIFTPVYQLIPVIYRQRPRRYSTAITTFAWFFSGDVKKRYEEEEREAVH
jgi:hypothetical protein